MKSSLFLFAIFFAGSFLFAELCFSQDFDVYPKMNNDNFNFPSVYEKMQYQEFQLLSRDVRMMDMGYAVFVPGYVHFKAEDKATAYALLGGRLLGYAGLLYNLNTVKKSTVEFADIFNGESTYKDDVFVFTSAVILIGGTYLFDWIHGKWRLENKQEAIRYRYSFKMQLLDAKATRLSDVSYIPSVSFQFKF